MLVKALETCFVDGHRRKEGTVFEYTGKPCARLQPVKAGEAIEVKPQIVEISTEEVKKRLGDYGVKFAPATGREKLLALLAEAEGK